MKSQLLSVIGIGSIVVFSVITAAYAGGGQLTSFKPVLLQATTPGTAQAGNTNITGTAIAGQVVTNGFQLGTSANSGHVLTANASGVGTWQAVPALSLPFVGAGSSPVLFDIDRKSVV